MARISGNLDLSNNGRIVNLVNPTNAQDAATKTYVDTEFGSSGVLVNRPTIQRDDASNNTRYLTFIDSSDIPGDGLSKRALMRCESSLSYNPSTNTLTAGTFSGSLSGNASSADACPTLRGNASAGIITQGVYRMYITPEGNIGIGTTSPSYPIHVDVTTVSASSTGASSTSGWWWGSGASSITQSSNIASAPAAQIAMKLNGSVWIDRNLSYVGFWQTSDRRIKKNINYNISSECITLFRKLKCTNYSYIDEQENKTNVYGYIAQDVSTVLPYAVTTQTGFIPSLYSLAKITIEDGLVKITCSEQKPYIFHSLHDKDGTAFVTDKNEPASDKEGGRHFKVKLFDISMNEFIVKINQIVDNGVFTIENDETSVKLTDTEYFVFGQEVDDYKILNNEAITMVATAVLQEVDRQQQADKARIAELEATVAEQQSLINEILERLKALEKA